MRLPPRVLNRVSTSVPTLSARSLRPAPLLLELDLTRGLLETPPASPVELLRARHVPVLRSVVEALRRAASDSGVAGLVAHVGRVQPTLAQSAELRRAVREFARHGKPTICWSESFGEMGPGNIAYHLASGFEEVWLQPTGDLGLTGVVAEAVFVRDALDKLGVRAQIGQRYEYKTAANTFLESSMTEAHREMATRLAESAMHTICSDIAEARGLDAAAVRAAVDDAPLTADDARARGLVDRLGYRDEAYAAVRSRLGEVRLRYVDRYHAALARATRQLRRPTRHKPVVAVVQASGPIHLGRSTRGLTGGPTTGADTVGAALRAAARHDDVRAVVLRVDSPGGSYVASDAIRREVLSLRRSGTPVVASMASVAASGGYYVAMPADVVVANAGTLTGSIGVLAGKQVLHDALSRIGVQRDSVSTGTFAEMFSTDRPYTDAEWQRLEQWLDRIYADFTAKAADDRGLDVQALREVARGRVWTGADAADRGLVDRIGGLSDAVDLACERARVRREDVAVHTLPRLSLADRVRPAENSDAAAAAGLGQSGSAQSSVTQSGLHAELMTALGLPVAGVLTMPVRWRLS